MYLWIVRCWFFKFWLHFKVHLSYRPFGPARFFSKKDFKTKCGIGEVLDASRKKTQRKRKTSGHIKEKKKRTNKFWIEQSLFEWTLLQPLTFFLAVKCQGYVNETRRGKKFIEFLLFVYVFTIPFQMRVSKAVVDAIKTKGGDNTSYVFGQTFDILCT